jgi:signal transduction histidine kinase
VIPNRDGLVQFARQVTAIDERLLDTAEEQIQLVQAAFQRRVTAISTLALIMGAILAIVVVLHTRRLGAEADERYNETLAAREDLRRLSDRLVTVQEEERRSLSRELHDELGQVMSAILMEIGKLDSTVPGSGVHRETLASVRRLAEENVAKVRDMALLLRPAMLDELGLIPALRWQAREVARRTGLKVKVIANELNDDLADANRTCVFRVVQEALNNCAKHSRASEVRVIVQRDSDGLSISVQDDGVGFDPARNKGLGLLGMMERVSGLGGQFHIESKPGNGTILSTWFRLENDRCKVEEHVA